MINGIGEPFGLLILSAGDEASGEAREADSDLSRVDHHAGHRCLIDHVGGDAVKAYLVEIGRAHV